jgi:hypothetical protein
MRLFPPFARCATAGVVLAAGATGAGAAGQPRNAGAPVPACTPIPAAQGAAITFGHEGGSLRPRTVTIAADGRVRAGSDTASDSLTTIPPAAVAALARLARSGGFWTLRPPSVRRPPRNPDAARTFIAVALTCGARRAEYVMGEPIPALFVELEALLTTVIAASPIRQN